MPAVVVNGARLNYVQLECQDGQGHEDLVMVHGLATNMAFWYFQYATRLSQRRFRVTLFDLRGHGRSEMTAGGYRPDNLARDLQGLLDALGQEHIERTHSLDHTRRQMCPFFAGNKSGDDIKRNQTLCTIGIAIDVKGNTDTAEQQLGLSAFSLQLMRGHIF